MTTKPLADRLAQTLDPNISNEPPRVISELPPPLEHQERELQLSEGVEVAGLFSLGQKAGQKIGGVISEQVGKASKKMGGELLEGVTKPGVKSPRDPVIIPDEAPVAKASPKALEGKAAEVVAEPPPSMVSEQAIADVAKRKEQLLQEGKTIVAPSPTSAQVAAGVEKGPISTVAFDNDEMRAMIIAASENAIKEEPKMSVRSIYMRAVNAGVPAAQADRILAGLPLESNVGNYELAKNVAGLVKLHDDSAAQLDNLFLRLSKGQSGTDIQPLDDMEKLQLRQQMAFHNAIVQSLKGTSVDLGRAMNVFKRVRDTGPGLKQTDIRMVLDNMGDDQVLLRLAQDYLDLSTREHKNKLLELGIGKKTAQAWMYGYQGMLLTNPDSHAAGLASNLLFTLSAPIERTGAVAIGAMRQKLGIGSPDRYYMGEVLASLSGIQNGLMDGLEFAAHVAKTGQRATAKGDQPLEPIRAEYFSNVPIRTGNIVGAGLDIASMATTTSMVGVPVPVSPVLGGLMDFGKEVARTPDITNSWVGRAVDRLGTMYSMPFRALAVADEGVGGVAARMELHRELWLEGNIKLDKLMSQGMSEADATKEVQKTIAGYLKERPATIAANVEKFRKITTLMDELDRSKRLGEFYWQLDKLLQTPAVKIYVPFARSLTNLFIEGSGRVPLLNVLSPRFWDDWDKGGRHRDVAMSRLAIGATIAGSFAWLAMSNRVSGSGPQATEDKKVLGAMGYQDSALILDSDEISDQNFKRLAGLTKVTRGGESLEGKIFISFKRFEPVSYPAIVGASFGDYLKFHRGDPDDPELLKYALALANGVGEFTTTLPAAQGIGDLVSILRSRQEDGGEKVVEIFDRMARQYADFAFTGTPIMGAANSSIVAKFERQFDPELRSAMPSEQDIPFGARAIYEFQSRLFSRVPGLNKDVPLERDNIGRVQKVKNRGVDYWANWIPGITVTTGRASKIDETLASINHGISRPAKSWTGVSLSAEQYNRYKELYGQIIKLPGPDGVMRNLEQAIPFELKHLKIVADASGEKFRIGDKQKAVDALVSKYRRTAKFRMIGKDDSPQPGQDPTKPSLDEMAALAQMGLVNIEFPELAAAIDRNKEFDRIYGK